MNRTDKAVTEEKDTCYQQYQVCTMYPKGTPKPEKKTYYSCNVPYEAHDSNETYICI